MATGWGQGLVEMGSIDEAKTLVSHYQGQVRRRFFAPCGTLCCSWQRGLHLLCAIMHNLLVHVHTDSCEWDVDRVQLLQEPAHQLPWRRRQQQPAVRCRSAGALQQP